MLRWFSPMTTTDTRRSPSEGNPGGADRRGRGQPGGAPWPRRGDRPGRGPASPNRGPLANRRRGSRAPRGGQLGPGLREQVDQGVVPRVRAARPSRSRSHAASAGLCPPVDTVTSSRPAARRAGRVYEQRAGSSAAFTHTPAASPSSNTCLVDRRDRRCRRRRSGSRPTSPGRYGRSSQVTSRARTAVATTSGATTCTIAPAASRPRDLLGGHRAAADHQHPPARDEQVHRVRPGRRRARQLGSVARRPTGGPPAWRCW